MVAVSPRLVFFSWSERRVLHFSGSFLVESSLDDSEPSSNCFLPMAGTVSQTTLVTHVEPGGVDLATRVSAFVLNTARAHHNRAPSRQKGHTLKGRSGGLGAELEGSTLGSIPDSIEGWASGQAGTGVMI